MFYLLFNKLFNFLYRLYFDWLPKKLNVLCLPNGKNHDNNFFSHFIHKLVKILTKWTFFIVCLRFLVRFRQSFSLDFTSISNFGNGLTNFLFHKVLDTFFLWIKQIGKLNLSFKQLISYLWVILEIFWSFFVFWWV